ncbi:unnamed protein product [Phytomonas sp. EM1]|nr:unnamed protein product [Phytomonas sp. EM1]|eukprot:CCW63322.1 unnamed protein product [Phytomonas sp. isolate EM1]
MTRSWQVVSTCQAPHLRFATRMFATASQTHAIGVSEFAARRRRLLSCLDPDTLLLVLASDEVIYSQDILYPHRQNSLFYHLFGLREPLRQTLRPPTSAFTNDVRLTCGAFMKTNSELRTFLFVPPQTTDPADLVWSSQPKTLEDFSRNHLGPCRRDEQNHATKEGCNGTDGSSLKSENVHVNDIKTIASVLFKEIQASAQNRWERIVEKHGSLSFSNGDLEEKKARLLYKEFDPLPKLLIEFPTQLRWTRQQYHLEVPQNTSMVECFRRRIGLTHANVAFRHPFEALMCVILAFRFTLTPSPSSLASQRFVGLPTPECSYHLPLHLQGSCGVSVNSNAQQERIRYCLTLPGSASTIKTAACGVVKRTAICSAEDLLCRYRLFKSPRQIRQHLWSAAATRQAFRAAMRRAVHTTSEHNITIAFHKAILDLSERVGPDVQVHAAYIPVVASGVRATEIHYTRNNGNANAGDLLRLDGGVEVNLVPTDCTRTFPVCQSSFSTVQKKIYNALLQIQQELFQGIQSGRSTSEVSKKHIESTRQALEGQLGVRNVSQIQVRSLFCAHSFGHLMGLDIHEQFAQSKDMLERGMTFGGGMVHTIEPGIYFPDVNRATAFDYDITCVPQALRGIGVQIEDNVLILPRSGNNAEEQSPWSRLDYLNEILRAIEELLNDEYYVKDCVFLQDERFQYYKPQLTSSQFSVLYFLLLQRTSLLGFPKALESLPLDAARVQTHFTEKRPLADWAPPSCEWYPFEVVVLTACIPKEIPHIEDYMN